MVLFNHSTRELTAKIVYYGPGLCGKTTNLRVLHERLEKGNVGRLLSLSTAQDRTIYFDLLPVELGNIKGYTVRFQLCTVPGQVFYNETRKLVLRGVDGIVFVVDSQWSMLSHNLESFQNLRENMREAEMDLDAVPVVIQYNKRDLPGVLSVGGLQESLNFQSFPYVEAVANEGKGVVETFKLISRLTFVELLRRLQKSGGLEGESLAAADGAHDESLTRALSRADRRPEPEPTPFTDSPFETTGSWPAPPAGEVFGEMTGSRRRTVAPGPPPSQTSAPNPAAASAVGTAAAEADHGPFSVAIRVPMPPPPTAESLLALEPFGAPAPPPSATRSIAPTAPIASIAPTAPIAPIAPAVAAVPEAPPPPPPAPPAPVPLLEAPPPPPPPEPRATLSDVQELRRGLEALAEIAAPLADSLAALRQELDGLRGRVESVAADAAGANVATGSLGKELGDLRGQVLEMRGHESDAATAHAALRDSIARLEASSASDQARLSEVVADSEDVKGGIRELAGRIELLAGSVESAQAVTNDLGARVTALGASALTAGALDALRSELTGLVAPVREELASARAAVDVEAERRGSALAAHRDESGAALERLASDLASRRNADAAALDELRQRVERELAATNALAAQGRDGVAGLEARLAEAREELRSHRAHLETRASGLEESLVQFRSEVGDGERRREEGLVPLLAALETIGADRARRDAEAADLARRLAAFEDELAREREAAAEARRVAEERVSSAEGRVRKLADSLRQALSALGD